MTKQVIICVDDEITVLESLKAELKNTFGNEYIIEMAEGGEDAIDLVEELLEDNWEIPLIISDYLMPGMTGDEVLTRVHQLSPKTLKVLLTGQASIEAVGNAINNAKLYRYISKPWQAEDMKLTVTEAIYSYLQDKKLTEKNTQLLQMNQELEALNREQAALIAKLHTKERRLQQFLEAMPMAVLVVDISGKPHYMNSRAQELLGKGIVENTTAELLRETYQIYLAGSDEIYPKERDPILCAFQGKSVNIDDMEIRLNNKTIPLEVWGTPIYDENGDIAYAIAAFTNITERKKSEAERDRFTQQLSQLNLELEKALDAELELTEAASRFVPNEFLSFLGYESIVDVKLGEAIQKEMSVLFSDIRDFTALSEKMTPEDNFKFINGYLSRMEPAILENHGFIDKYIGDAIMALFPESADQALTAAIAMLQMLTEYNTTRQRPDRPPIKIGIGINTGTLMLGTVGGQNRMDGTVISDAVNLASRVESLTKNYGVSLLITHKTFVMLEDVNRYAIRLIDRVTVQGKTETVSVFEVFDADRPEMKEYKLATRTTFEKALLLYYTQQFKEAAKYLQKCLQQNGSDKVAQIYLERCQRYEK